MSLTIGFAGMTHLGINSAVATAEKGFKVICFDQNQNFINKLNRKELPIIEPELPELLAKNANRLLFTSVLSDLRNCAIVYIALDVLTDAHGKSDLTNTKELIQVVSPYLNEQAILVILCQVPPGFTRALPFPKERLYYQVETLVFGRALERALYPERFIIGCENPNRPLPASYQSLLNAFNCPVLSMRYESAELAKISINCCLVASIGVANTLSEICEKIGADWSEIVPALKLDKRIGSFAYLAPGLGIAGGNLERDLATILELSHQHGTEASIVSSWLKNSQYRRDWVLKVLQNNIKGRKKEVVIGILGLAYKENTHSTKNSPALALLHALQGYSVKAFDPVVTEIPLAAVTITTSISETLENADAVVIMTPWDHFREVEPSLLLQKMTGKLVIDPYRILNGQAMNQAGFNYLTLGVEKIC